MQQGDRRHCLLILLHLANEFMLTEERKRKLRLNDGHKTAFSKGTSHVSRTHAPDVVSENVFIHLVRQQKCLVLQCLVLNNVVQMDGKGREATQPVLSPPPPGTAAA